MIVRCTRLFNPNTETFYTGSSNGFLTIDGLYSVLEIYYDEKSVKYRVFSDGDNYYGHPILIRANDFEIVSGIIPANWELYRWGNNEVSLGPKSWNLFDPWEESFWQDYDNNLPKAKECFEKELKIIFDADGEYIKAIDKSQNREPYFKI